MMRSTFFYVLLAVLQFASEHTQAQFIKGEVLDYTTNEPVPFAHVYFNSSMRGTNTDQFGHFHLLTKDFEGQQVVVSCVGYDTWILKEWKEGTTYRVYLKPSSNLLPELYITSGKRKRSADIEEEPKIETRDISRKRKEKMFLREFLGTTENGLSCTIENLEDVQLDYQRWSKRLRAFCDKPIIIYNRSLGYKIRYYLNDFELHQDHFFYQGYYLFEDDTTLSLQELQIAQKNRSKAYDGSRMHFFRELWRKSTYKLKFLIHYADTEDVVSLDSLVGDIRNHVRLMRAVGNLDISYKEQLTRITFIDGEDVPFGRTGFYDSKHIRWEGRMAERRVGDLLPFEFWP